MNIFFGFTLADMIGFVGVFILLLAFLLNVFRRISSNHWIYITMNIIGAGLACIASIMIDYLPFVILEGTWTVVSVVALVNRFRTVSDT